MPVNFGKILRGAGEFAATMEDPQWKAKRAIREAQLAREKAQTGLIGAQTEATGAETALRGGQLKTEGLRQEGLQAEIDQIAEDKKALEAVAASGQIPNANLKAAKAILDQREFELKKKVDEANINQSNASAEYSRAGAARLNDPTRRALETQALVDVHKARRAQTAATEALGASRGRAPRTTVSNDLRMQAEKYATKEIEKETIGGGFFGFGARQEGLTPDSPEWNARFRQLMQDYYSRYPELQGSAATTPLPDVTGKPDGRYQDPSTGQIYLVMGGRIIQPVAGQPQGSRTGLGVPQPSVDTEGWEP